MNYNVQDWYWIVAGGTSQVFSTSALAYVSSSDATYVDWVAEGNRATRIDDAMELFHVLVDQWMPRYLATGVAIVSTGTPALSDTYPMDTASQANITGIAASIAAGRGLPGGEASFEYQGHAFDSTNFLNFATAAESWVYSVYQALGAIVMTGIGALPTQPVAIA